MCLSFNLPKAHVSFLYLSQLRSFQALPNSPLTCLALVQVHQFGGRTFQFLPKPVPKPLSFTFPNLWAFSWDHMVTKSTYYTVPTIFCPLPMVKNERRVPDLLWLV
jgi:hypothetical protein